jgi:hypothetical protein
VIGSTVKAVDERRFLRSCSPDEVVDARHHDLEFV